MLCFVCMIRTKVNLKHGKGLNRVLCRSAQCSCVQYVWISSALESVVVVCTPYMADKVLLYDDVWCLRDVPLYVRGDESSGLA